MAAGNDTGTAVKNPDCFAWHDPADPSCRKCLVKEACQAKQASVRPACFGKLYEPSSPECRACLDNSLCQESIKMATTIRIKRAAPAAPEAEEEVKVAEATEAEPEEAEEEADEPEVEETEVGPYDDLGIKALREECEARDLPTDGRKSELIERLMQDDDEQAKKATKAVAPKVAVPTKPAAAKAAAAKATPAPAAKAPVKPEAPAASAAPKQVIKTAPKPQPIKRAEEPAEEEAPAPKAATTSTLPTVAEMMEAMATGSVLVITKVSDKQWQVSQVGAADIKAAPTSTKASKGLRGDDYWKEVLTPEYYQWLYVDAGTGKPWQDMTAEEKVAFADGQGIEYAQSTDERLTMMNLVTAVLAKLGISKWKPEYAKPEARNRIKAG